MRFVRVRDVNGMCHTFPVDVVQRISAIDVGSSTPYRPPLFEIAFRNGYKMSKVQLHPEDLNYFQAW